MEINILASSDEEDQSSGEGIKFAERVHVGSDLQTILLQMRSKRKKVFLATANISRLATAVQRKQQSTCLTGASERLLEVVEDPPKGIFDQTITATVISNKTASAINSCLTILSSKKLVYISRRFSLCTINLHSGVQKELFFLPSDWINPESIDLAMYWKEERLLLYPNSGEVAFVACSSV